MKRLRWLLRPAIEAIHQDLIGRYGGVAGLRDPAALDSALARPRHLAVYRPTVSVPRLAAAYGWGLLRNHPFVDGNKRIALAAILVFLERNGWEWLPSEVEETATVLAAAAGAMSEREWNAWVERNSAKKVLR